MIKKLPWAVSGLMLGMTAFARLLSAYSAGWALLFYSAGIGFGLLYLIKIACFRSEFLMMLKKPMAAGIAGTFPMALMLLASALSKVFMTGAVILWWTAFLLHMALILWFCCYFFPRFKLLDVYASWYIVFIGTAIGAVTSASVGYGKIGGFVFWCDLVCLLILVPLVLYRYSKDPKRPEMADPLICFNASPASLCLAAGLMTGAAQSLALKMALLVLALIMTFVTLCFVPKLLCLPFYPGDAALAFPFSISAIALGTAIRMMSLNGVFWQVIDTIEIVVAGFLTLVVLIRYVLFMLGRAQ